MKKITLYIIALCSSIGVMAAEYEYVPVVREGVEWGYYDIIAYSPDQTPHRIQLKGDEVINNLTYKKVYRYSICSIDGEDCALMGWIREQDKKVYFLINKDMDLSHFTPIWSYFMKNIIESTIGDDESLIYDFSPEKVGDKINLYFGGEQVVTAIDMIEINGKLRKQFHYSAWFHPIVEGQGTICHGGGDLIFPGMPEPPNGSSTSVLNYIKTLDGAFEFKKPNFNNSIDPCVASVEDIGKDKLNITQNNDAIAIDIPMSGGVSVIELVDVSGRVVYSKYVDSQSTFTLSTTSFAHGTYILIVSSDSTKLSRKIAIK